MATQRDFLIIGDSNVRRSYAKLGLQSNSINFVQARSYEEVSSSLSAVNATYKFIVFAFVTNLIINAGDECSCLVDRTNALEELFNTLLQLLG